MSDSRKFDVIAFIRREFNASKEAARGLIAHGQVTIDGHVVRPEWVKHWTDDQVRGRMMAIPGAQKRILGSPRFTSWESEDD